MTPARSKTAAVPVYPFEKMQTDLQYRYVIAGVLPEAATASLQRKTPHPTSPSGRAAEQNKARHCACTNCRGEDMKCNAADTCSVQTPSPRPVRQNGRNARRTRRRNRSILTYVRISESEVQRRRPPVITHRSHAPQQYAPTTHKEETTAQTPASAKKDPRKA